MDVNNQAVPLAYVPGAEDRQVNRSVAGTVLKSALVVGAFVATASIFSWEVALIGGTVALICWAATLGNRDGVFYNNYIAPAYRWPGRVVRHYIPRRNRVDNVGLFVPVQAPVVLRQPVAQVPAYQAPAAALRPPVVNQDLAYQAPVALRPQVNQAPSYYQRLAAALSPQVNQAPAAALRPPVNQDPAYQAPAAALRPPVNHAPAYQAPAAALRPPVNHAPAYQAPAAALRPPVNQAPAQQAAFSALRQPVNNALAARDYGAVNLGAGGPRREAAGNGLGDPRRR